MRSWKGLEKRAARFDALGVRVIGIASDSQSQLAEMCKAHGLSFTMLSDPLLVSHEVLDVPISSKTAFRTALPLHPILRHLPQKAFLQPAFFVWRQQQQVHAWRQTEKLRNLFGANGRPLPRDILAITERMVSSA